MNYWELKPSSMGSKLDELLKQGISQIATFVPWQAAESDISHLLTRFLLLVVERRMKVYLLLSPEVGIHYPNSGLPKDIVLKKENMAQHSYFKRVVASLPPNIFTLPSLFAPEFNKRYYSFLNRMDNIFSDLLKSNPLVQNSVVAILSGSYWKYYRSPLDSSKSIFSGKCGDYSSHAALVYRQKAENFLSQKEFSSPAASAVNRWKTQSLEEINRRWFYQQSEDVFRNRSAQSIQRKSSHLNVVEFELFTPEADPGIMYSNFIQMLSGGGPADFSKLSYLIDEYAARVTMASKSISLSYIHWTSMGGFRMMSESEKQFLILKSLLLMGGQKGGILLDESEWFSLSPTFRHRAEMLTRSLNQSDLQLRNRALYLTPHIWSNPASLWQELHKKLGSQVKMIATLDLATRDLNAKLLFVDPSFILTRETIQKLMAWTKGGRVIVLPRSQLYTDAAKRELEIILGQTKRFEVDLGFAFRLHAIGDGKLVIYDVLELSALKDQLLSSLQGFLDTIISIAEIEIPFRLSDSRLSQIVFERKDDCLAAFILNGTRRQVNADIHFPNDVKIRDLGSVFSATLSSKSTEMNESKVSPARQFSLDVPPFGILPLGIEGMSIQESREKYAAAMVAEDTRKNVHNVTASELPGLSETGLGELWT